MSRSENFLHTTHRTVTWFRKAFVNDELVLAAPFQRNPVWTKVQKAYLIDTILNALPIPELYMQDRGDDQGNERHIVVDGQQRIRAVLEFVNGELSLDGEDITRQWRGLKFEDLSSEDKIAVFNYKFVVRILPPELEEEEIRKIFARLNKNVVALNEQELRNATYWGPFIRSIQSMADDDSYWSNCGVFSANDYRRMLDHEFISELAVAYLHGPQNKKDKLDTYYRTYEEDFDQRREMEEVFRKVTLELTRFDQKLDKSRWKKKSDFYTMFLEFAGRADRLPFDGRVLRGITNRIVDLGHSVDSLLRLDEDEWGNANALVVTYARNVARAASDRGSRIARAEAFARVVFQEEAVQRLAEVVVSATVQAEAVPVAAEVGGR